MNRDGLIRFTVKINLRWPLRLVCKTRGHKNQEVISIHPLMGAGFNYCKRCGDGWRYSGFKKCWLDRQHRWGKDPYSGGPSRDLKTGEPFREIQYCPRCGKHRVIECATGQPVRTGK